MAAGLLERSHGRRGSGLPRRQQEQRKQQVLRQRRLEQEGVWRWRLGRLGRRPRRIRVELGCRPFTLIDLVVQWQLERSPREHRLRNHEPAMKEVKSSRRRATHECGRDVERILTAPCICNNIRRTENSVPECQTITCSIAVFEDEMITHVQYKMKSATLALILQSPGSRSYSRTRFERPKQYKPPNPDPTRCHAP